MLEVNAGETQSFPFVDCAASHNGIFRGKDLTNVYTIDEICERISNGTFEDLYIGDYFDVTISTEYTANEVVRCVLAGFDTYWNNGQKSFLQHHAVIVLKNSFHELAPINQTNTTVGGYLGSYMWNTVLPIYTTALQSALGNHIITHNLELTCNIDTESPSSAGSGEIGSTNNAQWTDVYINLLSEIQIFGCQICSSSWVENGCDNLQLPLFRLDPTAKICGKSTTIDGNGDESREIYWLRNISAINKFTHIDRGFCCNGFTSFKCGIRPYFLIG